MIPKIKNNGRWFLVVALIVGLVLRMKDIFQRDFWYDEAFTGIAVRESFSGLLSMIRQDVHPPLYYFSLKIFAGFFDYSVFGIRFWSLLFGAASIVAVFYLSKKLFGARAAVFASFVTAVSPFAVQYSAEGRMYAMFVFFVLIAVYFFVIGLQEKKSNGFLWAGFFVGLSALTHYMGLIMLPIFYLAYLGWKIMEEKILENSISRESFQKLLKSFLPEKKLILGLIIFGLIFAFWLPNFIFHLGKSKNSNLDWIKPTNFGDIPVNVQMFVFGTPIGEMSAGMPSPNEIEGVNWLSLSVLFTIFLTGLFVWSLGREKKRKEIFLVWIFSLGFMIEIWALSLLGKNFFVARYLMSAGFFIFILIGYWLSKMRLLYLAVTLAVYFSISFLAVDVGYSKGWNKFQAEAQKYSDYNFYVLNSFDYVIAKYYWGANRLILYNLDWPIYNPDYWAAIGKTLKRTEKFSDLKKAEKSLIISNGPLPQEKKPDPEYDSDDWEIFSQYDNIFIYRLKK